MKISFDNLVKFHNSLLVWYSRDGWEKILLEPLPDGDGFMVWRFKNNMRTIGPLTTYKQNEYNKDLDMFIE